MPAQPHTKEYLDQLVLVDLDILFGPPPVDVVPQPGGWLVKASF
ncbi:hypothetical protein [Pseudonocardia aurantiaca]|uniref:Uncharacterized protein n=1 Tax=Pseudonocardia aurantiaca TaxID=75290 RepID=A0ABW4FBA6_9PSEU